MLRIQISLSMVLVYTNQRVHIFVQTPERVQYGLRLLIILENKIFIYVVFVTEGMHRPIKHVLDDIMANKAGNAQYSLNLVKGVTLADPFGAVQSEVNANSAVVTHIELEIAVWLDQTGVASTVAWDDFFLYIWFNIASAQTKPTGYSIGTNDLKNQVFFQTWGKLGAVGPANTTYYQASESIRRFHVSLEIPKAYQTIGKDDAIQLVVDWPSQAAAIHNLRVQAIFKEYYQV